MKTVTKHIRDHLNSKVPFPVKTLPKYPHLFRTRKFKALLEWFTLMFNRNVVGGIRYAEPSDYPYAEDAIKRIKTYLVTGNTELLVDASNLCFLEKEFSSRTGKHFTSIDR